VALVEAGPEPGRRSEARELGHGGHPRFETQRVARPTHDVFGAFGRGQTDEPRYLDAQAVRQRLLEPGLPLDEAAAINRAI